MAKKFDHILDLCSNKIKLGEADIASCLDEYPQYASKLEPLLETVLLLCEEPQPEPEPNAAYQGAQMLQRKLIDKRQAIVNKRGSWKSFLDRIYSSVGTRRKITYPVPHWQLRWVAIMTGVVAFITILIGGVTLSSHIMPDEPLYSTKIAVEQFRLRLTPSTEEKGKFQITLAERRMEELTEMSKSGKTEQAVSLVPLVAQHVEEASRVIVNTEKDETAHELKVKLEESATQQLATLESALEEATEETRPAIVQALDASGESYGTALETAIAREPIPAVVGNLGTIHVVVTDPPPPQDIDSLIVEVERVEVHMAAGSDSKWVTIIDEPSSFDLMELLEGNEVMLGSSQIETGTYTQARMDVTKATVIVGDEEHEVFIPSGSLKFIRPFQIKSEQTRVIVFDFDGKNSINVTGSGRYIMKPVVSLLVPDEEELLEANTEDNES